MAGDGGKRTLRWDDSRMKASYADVCNVSATPDALVLSFGMLKGATQQGATVAISNRLVLNSETAVQLAATLQSLVRDYEARHGALPDGHGPR